MADDGQLTTRSHRNNSLRGPKRNRQRDGCIGRYRIRIRTSTVTVVLSCLCVALVSQQFQWLRTIARERSARESLRVGLPPMINPTNETSVGVELLPLLVFRFPNRSGQGTGNVLSGALAAQMLAEEYNRTLCHSGMSETAESDVYDSFKRAFELNQVLHQETCDRILQRVRKGNDSTLKPNVSNTIVQNNYDQKSSEQSECSMSELLSNHRGFPIVYYEGNTYPRWPNIVISKRDRFRERFQPTQALKDTLPWKESEPPPVVAHLRQGDSDRDHRDGLDEKTLSLLARESFLETIESPSVVFLVTNNVEWYARFPDWSHPSWSKVHHSALRSISWGGGDLDHQRKDDSDLQMWADWYTLLSARKIYHTASDFSRSASRWNEKIESWTIRGSNEDGLVLKKDGEGSLHGGVPKLVDRATNELWFCGKSTPSAEEQMHVQEKRERQLLDLVRARKRQRGIDSLVLDKPLAK